jgi:hypothetical protein
MNGKYEEERRSNFVQPSEIAAFTLALACVSPAIPDWLMHPKLTDEDRHAIIEAAIAAAINAVMIGSMQRQGVPQDLIDKSKVMVMTMPRPKKDGAS